MPDAPIRGQGVTVNQLFFHHSFRLDYYQREYSWTRADVTALLSDLRRRFTDNWKPVHEREHVRTYSPYFLGSIVYYDGEDDATYLVDGQQRVTTLFLLLIHLRRLARELGHAAEVRRLDPLIWSHGAVSGFRLNIPEFAAPIGELVDDRQYEPPVQATPSVRNLLERAADLAEDFPGDLAGDALPPFVTWLLDKVCLVQVRALGRDQGWEIFETVNDRGQRPGPVDLFKSHVLTKADHEQDHLNHEWRRTMAGLASPIDFVKALLVARYAAPSRDDVSRIEAAFHEWVRDNGNHMGLVKASDYRRFVEEDLVQLGARYARLRAAAEAWDRRLPAVHYNEYNRVPHHLTAVLAAVRPSDTEDAFVRKAELVSGFLDLVYVRRLVNGAVVAADLESDVLTLIPRLRSCADIGSLRRVLGESVVQIEDEFGGMETFGLQPGNRAAVRYLLGRITAFVDGECGRSPQIAAFLSPSRPFDVEHIWANKFERFQGEVGTMERFTSWRNRLGALLLLSRSVNASFGADPYADKLDHYQRANLLAASLHRNTYRRNPGFTKFLARRGLTTAFQAYNDFGVDAIRARQSLYRRLCELIWDPSELGLELPRARVPRQASRSRARYGVKVRQLVDAGAIRAGTALVGNQKGIEYRARVTANGMIELATGETFTDPSPAGAFVLNAKACSGWEFWSAVEGRDRRRSLKEIRNDALKRGLL
jgi:Protein of unknown function DUF262/Restriction Enzyme Adenine Methylase Associated/Protein of unknown function (DUF1524)